MAENENSASILVKSGLISISTNSPIGYFSKFANELFHRLEFDYYDGEDYLDYDVDDILYGDYYDDLLDLLGPDYLAADGGLGPDLLEDYDVDYLYEDDILPSHIPHGPPPHHPPPHPVPHPPHHDPHHPVHHPPPLPRSAAH